MMARDGHATREIEAMGVEPLNTRIEVKLVAACLTSAQDQPLEQSASEGLRATLSVRDQVVHVANAPPGETVEKAVAGHRTNLRVCFQISEVILLRALASNTLHKLV